MAETEENYETGETASYSAGTEEQKQNVEEILAKYSLKTYKDNKENMPDFLKYVNISPYKESTPILKSIDSYYNFYGVTTPKVSISFLKDLKRGDSNTAKKTWLNLDEVGNGDSNNNFFVSAKIDDNGSRKMSLTLFDRTFYTLQNIIFKAIKLTGANTNTPTDDQITKATQADIHGSDISSNIRFVKYNTDIVNNIKIRWGYTDCNPSSETTTTLTNPNYFRFEENGSRSEIASKSNSRWNDRTGPESEVEKDGEITSIGSYSTVANEKNQSTIISQEEEFFITNVKTSLTATGIKYTINAVGADSFVLNSYKFVQMYSELRGTAKELMAFFMKTFNEPKVAEGLNAKDSSLLRVCWDGEEDIINGTEYVKDYFSGEYVKAEDEDGSTQIDKENQVMGLLQLRKTILKNSIASLTYDTSNTIGEECLYGNNAYYKEVMSNDVLLGDEIKNIDKRSLMDTVGVFYGQVYKDRKFKDVPKLNSFNERVTMMGVTSEKWDKISWRNNKDPWGDNKTELNKRSAILMYLYAIYAYAYTIDTKELKVDKDLEFKEYEKFVKDLENNLEYERTLLSNCSEVENYKYIDEIDNYLYDSGITKTSNGISIWEEVVNQCNEISQKFYKKYNIINYMKLDFNDIKLLGTKTINISSQVYKIKNERSLYIADNFFNSLIINFDALNLNREVKEEDDIFIMLFKFFNFYFDYNYGFRIGESNYSIYNFDKPEDRLEKLVVAINMIDKKLENDNRINRVIDTIDDPGIKDCISENEVDNLNLLGDISSYIPSIGDQKNSAVIRINRIIRMYKKLSKYIKSYEDNKNKKEEIINNCILKSNLKLPLDLDNESTEIDNSSFFEGVPSITGFVRIDTQKKITSDTTIKIFYSEDGKKEESLDLFFDHNYNLMDNIKNINVNTIANISIFDGFVNIEINSEKNNKKKIKYLRTKQDIESQVAEILGLKAFDLNSSYDKRILNSKNRFNSNIYTEDEGDKNKVFLSPSDWFNNNYYLYEIDDVHNVKLAPFISGNFPANVRKKDSKEIKYLNKAIDNIFLWMNLNKTNINKKGEFDSESYMMSYMKDLAENCSTSSMALKFGDVNNQKLKEDVNIIKEILENKVIEEEITTINDTKVKNYVDKFRERLEMVEEDIEKQQKILQELESKYKDFGIIKISLGGEDAIENYKNGTVVSNPKKFKSVSSSLNSYAVQAPPYKEYGPTKNFNSAGQLIYTSSSDGEEKQSYTTINENGEEVTTEIKSVSNSRKMSWSVVGKDEEGRPIVGFHYVKPIRPKYIRQYDWGTGNPSEHCVKDVNIETTSEFGMMSSASFVNVNNGTSQNIGSEGTKVENDSSFINNAFVNAVVRNDTDMERLTSAMVNGVKQGTIQILGDPSLRFDGNIQPASYPIYLNIQLQLDRAWSDVTPASQSCQLSGYYVVTEISHNLSNRGYTTDLKVMSYPGLSKLINNQ